MRLHRFYIEDLLVGKKEIEISDVALLHQMKNVFRLEKGNRVIFFCGDGKDYECAVELISKKEGRFIVEKENKIFISEKRITLYLSLIKKDNFELATRMATEIGVSRIVPILTERSEKKNIDLERLKRIVKEASEQCGRGNLPEISAISKLQIIISKITEGEIIVADFGGEQIRNYNLELRNFNLFIGPEGGWSDSEREFFKEKGAKFISLGSTVLRAETAVVVASAFILN